MAGGKATGRAAPDVAVEVETPAVPTVVAGPPIEEPARPHIWTEAELLAGALREDWTEEQHAADLERLAAVAAKAAELEVSTDA